MAQFQAGVNHPLAVKLWSKKLFREALKQTYFSKFIGEDSNSGIQLLTETKKDRGDTVYVGLRMQLSGAGVQGHATLEGNEEDLTLYRDAVVVDELIHAARSNVRITQQRVPFEVREECRMGLQDWWSDRIDTTLANQLAGNTGQSDTRYTGNQVCIAPSTTSGNTRLLIAGATASDEASLSDTASFNMALGVIDRAVVTAKTATPLMRPFRVDGGEYFAMILHPYQVHQLRTNTATGQWLDIQKAAMQGGKVGSNPIFTGALGVYNNVVLHENTRIPNTVTAGGGNATTANCRRAIFMGAQAAAMAVGMNNSPEKMTWVEEYFDYQRSLGVSAGMIFGVKKMVFNSIDFGVIVVSTYSPAP